MSGTRLATNWIKFNVDLLHPIGSLCTLSEKVPGKFEYKNAVNNRVIYLANHGKAIYVLHAFRKKTQKTRHSDIKLARAALSKLLHRNMS